MVFIYVTLKNSYLCSGRIFASFQKNITVYCSQNHLCFWGSSLNLVMGTMKDANPKLKPGSKITIFPKKGWKIYSTVRYLIYTGICFFLFFFTYSPPRPCVFYIICTVFQCDLPHLRLHCGGGPSLRFEPVMGGLEAGMLTLTTRPPHLLWKLDLKLFCFSSNW